MINAEELRKLVLDDEQIAEKFSEQLLEEVDKAVNHLASLGKTQFPESLKVINNNRAVEILDSKLLELGYHTNVASSDEKDSVVSFIMVGWAKEGLEKINEEEVNED